MVDHSLHVEDTHIESHSQYSIITTTVTMETVTTVIATIVTMVTVITAIATIVAMVTVTTVIATDTIKDEFYTSPGTKQFETEGVYCASKHHLY